MEVFNNKISVEVEILDSYENIKNRCLLTDFLNESANEILDYTNDPADLFPAMLLLKVIRIKAELSNDGLVYFTPLVSARINGEASNPEIIDYGTDGETNHWVICKIRIGEIVAEGKIAIEMSPRKTLLAVKDGET